MKKIIWGIALLFSISMVAGAHTCCHNSAQKCGCKRGYYTQYYGDKPELIRGYSLGRERHLAQWFRQGEATFQRKPRRFLSAVSEESAAMAGAFRLSGKDRFAEHSEGKAQDSGFRPRGKRRGQQERAAGKAPQRES